MPAATVSGARTTLYRAVSLPELSDIQQLNAFRPIPSSLQGKWFAEHPTDAVTWGTRLSLLTGDPFRVIRVEVPTDLADRMFRLPNLDQIGPARYADGDLLSELNQRHGGIHEELGIP